MARRNVTVKLMGGVGNQLFIYSFAQVLAAARPELRVSVTRSELSRQVHGSSVFSFDHDAIFGSTLESVAIAPGLYYLEALQNRLFPRGIRTVSEIGYSLDPVRSEIRSGFLRGYFQSSKYVDQLRNLGAPLLLRNLRGGEEEAELIRQLSASSFISVHARRGDYAPLTKSFGMLSIGYFQEAIQEAMNSGITRVLLFSDEPTWWMRSLDILPPADYTVVSGLSAESQLELMSSAEVSVISNSSFSLWGALAGPKKKAVIAPNPWFRAMDDPKSLIPEHPSVVRLQAQWD